MTEQGIYFSSEDNGAFSYFAEEKSIKLPKSILLPNDFYNIQLSASDILSYRFDSSYGDFLNMGAAVNLAEKNRSRDGQMMPDFTIYAWINKGDLLDERWGQSFMESSIKSGSLISTGKNAGVWWKPAK